MKLGFIAALATASLLIVTHPALSQDSAVGQESAISSKRITLKVDNADLRLTLKTLFDSAGANYSLDQAIQGRVPVALDAVPFRTALESLLRSTESEAPLTYRVEDGVYHISPKIGTDITDAVSLGFDAKPAKEPRRKVGKIALDWADVRDVVSAFGGTMLESRAGQAAGDGFGGGMGGFGGMGGMGGFNQGMGGFGRGMDSGGFLGVQQGNFLVGPVQGGSGFGGGMNPGNGTGGGFGRRGGGASRRR